MLTGVNRNPLSSGGKGLETCIAVPTGRVEGVLPAQAYVTHVTPGVQATVNKLKDNVLDILNTHKEQ